MPSRTSKTRRVPENGRRRVLRGGKFGGWLGGIRAAKRTTEFPHSGYDGMGFRVVMSPL